MSFIADVIVVGSGISGSFAAHKLTAEGLGVAMIDVGNDDAAGRERVGDQTFSEVIHDEKLSRSIFLGESDEGICAGETRVGAQLTPPRQFITKDTDRWLDIHSDSFRPMQSLAYGGLGAGWGAASFTYSEQELKECGIWDESFSSYYNEAAEVAGVSADPADDTSSILASIDPAVLQPAADLDENCEKIFASYRRAQRQNSMLLGRIPLALLSRDRRDGRRANPYSDMDFYGDARKSIFRPRYLVDRLREQGRLNYMNGLLAFRVKSTADGAEVWAREMATGNVVRFKAKRVILCAGALNTARMVLNSLPDPVAPVPILANPYHYIPSIHLRTLGRSVRDRRHSMAQLVAVYRPPEDPGDSVISQFYSYRTLLMFKLAKEIPLPPSVGWMVARTLLTSLTIVAVWHSCRPSRLRRLGIQAQRDDAPAGLEVDYSLDGDQISRIHRRENAVKRWLLRNAIVPVQTVDPGHAGGIHYAGTLPSQETAGVFQKITDSHGRVLALPHVFAGDSAPWNFLPAKGLSLTLMANAIRVSQHIAREIKG